MIRWEYVVEGFNRWDARQLHEILNDRGGDGWELAAIDWDTRVMIFKRWF
ncbi:hypothetical protein [Nonomuraea gerenzanensis]|uniref:DUF4177 domain-containing protein n=1 Tax=Nonomuraea gerenzanensis TaxID=93944 RepID=A0A1M4EMJ5_9ACTN|nr:hypothetical protein [Nonomuraea gerenzanensis]UBU11581.1 hypothetical protein LCN96_45960 [Nonomuraea gerenzanensis]SBP00076.1 hypothetical protein BN4615_P9592 [Nonomuraea gerenzanensis]